MKIVNLLHIVSCLERGGLELRLLDIARLFPDNYKLHFCVTSNQLDLRNEFTRANAKTIVVPIKRAYLEIRNISKINAYIHDNDIKLVNTYDFKGLLVGCLLKIIFRARISLVHNTVDLLHSYKSWHKMILKYLFKCVDKSICNSVQAKEVLESLGIKRSLITVIVNGVDTDLFQQNLLKRNEMRAFYGVGAGETLIGTVANFRWEKNYPFLIECFAILSESHPDLKLLCVGGGATLEEIKEMVLDKGINDKILFTGSVGNVLDYLGMMDIFVLCSIKESFPNCLIQAMSAQLPVIASNIGACSDIIVHGTNGLIYEVNNSEQFVIQVNKLLFNKDLRDKMAVNGLFTVKQKFSADSMIDSYLKIYFEYLNDISLPDT